MDKVKIDLLREKYDLGKSRPKPFLFFGRLFIAAIIVLAVTGMVFSYSVTTTGTSVDDGFKVSVLNTLKHLVPSAERELKGEEDDRVNLVLMGIGGAGHQGPQLTDTLIFASLRPSTKEVGMISIPRDLNVPIPGHGWRKINHANAFGEAEEKGTGPLLAKDVVENVLDQPIDYYIRVDFAGFADLIDDIGGIDIVVENSFKDPYYPSHGKEFEECDAVDIIVNEEGEEEEVPNYDCRYEELVFEKGETHLDGETALKFVRSRHGTNGEGSDFARARRQQIVITAAKDKILSASTLFNPSRINKILDTLKDNISTNLSTWEMLRLAKIFKDIETDQITSHVLDASSNSPLYATFVNGAYVLLPKQDDWTPIQKLAENIFAAGSTSEVIKQASIGDDEYVKIEIQNGTNHAGFAGSTSEKLDGQGFDVVNISNAQQKGYEQTIVYDFTNGQHPEELKSLRDYLNADVVLTASGWLISGDVIPNELTLTTEKYEHLASSGDIDFLVILGEDSAYLMER